MPADDGKIERAPERKNFVLRVLKELAVSDLIVGGFLLILNGAVLTARAGAERTSCLIRVGSLLAVYLVSLTLVRGRILRPGWTSALVYRIGIYGPVQLSYFFLKHVLPLVNAGSVDEKLYALDLRWFGVEPAMAMDAWVNGFTTEWFSFFYFSYFFLLAAHLIPILFLSRRPHIVGEFALGLVLVFCIGHTGYMLVPGFGPYRAMASSFQHAFPAGTWHNLVMDAVKSGGAQKDIFPSLHTAAPTFLALFSLRNRKELPFRYTWPFLGFAVANIVIATMFLRWHYLIDVIVGLALAGTAVLVSHHITRWELARRQRLQLTENWPSFFTARSRQGEVGTGVTDALSPWKASPD